MSPASVGRAFTLPRIEMPDKPKPAKQTGTPAKARVEDVDLDQDMLDWIDMRAQMKGVSRSDIISAALRQYRESHRPARKGTSWN